MFITLLQIRGLCEFLAQTFCQAILAQKHSIKRAKLTQSERGLAVSTNRTHNNGIKPIATGTPCLMVIVSIAF
jgi:hypothetical protein